MFPSPGIARSVWLLPQTSCNMVADADHPATETNQDKDGTEVNIVEQSHKGIFDLVKTG